jgi:membrane-bound serine protease (ClpP class)
VLFILGIALVFVELLLVPGTFIAGISGVMLMLVALVMGMVDVYPGTPTVPALPDLKGPLRDLSLAGLIALGAVLILARFLPETSVYHKLVSQSASGVASVAAVETRNESRLGKTGVTVTNLSPGGKARFDEDLVDVVTRGERIEKGRPIRITGHSGADAVVEEIT